MGLRKNSEKMHFYLFYEIASILVVSHLPFNKTQLYVSFLSIAAYLLDIAGWRGG